MSTSLLDRNTGYPSVFYQELEILNARKPLNAPVAVILKAAAREAWLADMPRIIQMTKTHRIILQRLDHDRSIGQNLKEAHDKTGKYPKKLVCLSHAIEAKNLELDEEKNEDGSFTLHLYSKENVKREDFDYLARDAEIFLSGCRSGSGGLDSLAQRIADMSHRTVFAPKEDLTRAATCFWEYPDGKWKMMSYRPDGVQHVYKFRHGRCPSPSSYKTLREVLEQSKDKKDIWGLFSSYAASMYHYAFENAQYQVELADFCNIGIPGCYSEDGIHWLLSAAEEENDSEAQYRLGCWYDKSTAHVEKSYENAFYWFQMAADQGHIGALYEMGRCFYLGLGCKQADSRALYYFQQAADQGHPGALYAMGCCYEFGIGTLVSRQRALFYFGLALQKGYEDARIPFNRMQQELERED